MLFLFYFIRAHWAHCFFEKIRRIKIATVIFQVPCMVVFGTGDKYLSVTAARGSAK
jgi:hypothetical protein